MSRKKLTQILRGELWAITIFFIVAKDMHATAIGKSNKYTLHIPRASLSASSCSGSSSKSSSRSREFSPNSVDIGDFKGRRNAGEISEMDGESESDVCTKSSIVGDRKPSYHNSNKDDDQMSRKSSNHPMYIVYRAGKPAQRKFNSTQSTSSSSSASNQSNYSVNSLLLSVKNLEHFNRSVENAKNGSDSKRLSSIKNDGVHRKQMLNNLKSVVTTIDRPDTIVKHNQKKDPDQLSTTSSATNTNFTVITFNGFGKNNRKKSKAICRRRHQVTIVIIIMTFLLFIGIFSAVCMLEMRYQKMPR